MTSTEKEPRSTKSPLNIFLVKETGSGDRYARRAASPVPLAPRLLSVPPKGVHPWPAFELKLPRMAPRTQLHLSWGSQWQRQPAVPQEQSSNYRGQAYLPKVHSLGTLHRV